jgi:hypothetical protein
LPKGGGGDTLPLPHALNRSIRHLRHLLALGTLLAAATPGAVRAEERATPVGFQASVDLGGGGQPGTGSAYGGASLFEMEATFLYDVALGLGPELSFVLGMTPGTYFAIRPGIRWSVPETPFYLRVVVDASTQIGYMSWRWVLLGAGFQLRFTDVLGFFAEGDTGFPIASGAGVPLLIRAGAFVSF